MGTFLRPRQSTRDAAVALALEDEVDEVVEEALEVVEEALEVEDALVVLELLDELPQVPNAGWQPVPQYWSPVPHQPDLSAWAMAKERRTELRTAVAKRGAQAGDSGAA
jgi:hypothetical protein